MNSVPGVKDVPLQYVIRDQDNTNDDELKGFSFTIKCILLTRIYGASFESDSRQVHQIITLSIDGTDTEQFLKPVARF